MSVSLLNGRRRQRAAASSGEPLGPTGVELMLKKMARANGKMTQKYQKNAKWPKITFRGPILVPEVAKWGFWGWFGSLKVVSEF